MSRGVSTALSLRDGRTRPAGASVFFLFHSCQLELLGGGPFPSCPGDNETLRGGAFQPRLSQIALLTAVHGEHR